MTGAEFAGKIAWEDGVIEALVYGLKAEDLDLGEDDALRAAWAELQSMWVPFSVKVCRVEDMLEKYCADNE
jgi:hypothetical protein